MKMHNLYQILEVNTNASLHVIKKAYRDKALSEHPDKGGDAERMALLTTAYQTLSDPLKRKQFDQEWEIYNASNDTELVLTSSGYLSTAGIPFSMSFRKEHVQVINQYQQKPLKKNQLSKYLQPFHSDLYPSSNAAEKNHGDLFSFIQEKEKLEIKLSIKFLTPEKAVEFFLEFLVGNYSIKNIQDLNQALAQKIQQLKRLEQQASYEFQLYQGIYEVLLLFVKKAEPTEKLLFSLQKITDYAKLTADQSMGFMAPLLQSKYFRDLFSQALHLYWLSEEKVLEESFLKAFDGQSAAERLIERLKLQLSENRSASKSNDQSARILRFARLLFKLEKDLNKRAQVTTENRAAFYREKAFHLLDWVPALMGTAGHFVIVNTLLQIGINFQKAAAQERKTTFRIADEKLAAKVYLVAVGIGRHATPDVELYACLHSVKALMACRYSDSELKETLEALQHRALWLADLFPFFQTPQSNSDLLAQDDQALVLMRQLLHALINKIDDKKAQTEKSIIDHSYVRVFYQAYEACLKNWYQKNHSPEIEKKFRQRLMHELLESKQWTRDDLDYNLNAPWPLNHLDEEGWTCPKSILRLAKNANIPTYKTVHGVELNYKTGKMAFILDYCQEHEKDYNRLLTLFDLNELIQRRLTSAIFSLDPADPNMPYHPFNQMRFLPSTLHHSQLLHTMLLTDYVLKFLTVGQEVQRRDPYELRPLDNITQHLPDYLKKVIDDFHASNHEESLHRFWIESEEVDLAIDDAELNKDGNVLFALGDIKMVVKHHKLKRDAEGNLVDKEGEDEGWDCYVLTLKQQRELERGKRIIPNSALLIIKDTWELIFWENNQATQRCTLERDRHHLIRLSKQARDAQEKVKIDNSESLRQIYRIVLKAAKKTGIPHRYSPEFIFAQEFTKYYNEFAIYFPEFGRLRELSKAATLVNVMAAQRAANQEEIQLSEKRLQDKHHWHAEEQLYWQTTERELKKLVREDITKQFETWRRQLSKEKIKEERQKSLHDLRGQIGTLKFSEFSPEIQAICDNYYEEIKRKIIAEHGYSGWDSVAYTIREDVIKPKIPGFILELQTQKKTSCRQQLLALFKSELAGLSSWYPSQLIDKFLDGDDKPLLDQLVKHDRKQVAKKIKEVYPEHTEESLDRVLNNSFFMIDEIVDRETEKALEQHKQQLKIRLGEREKLEKSFVDLGFAVNAEEIDLKEACLWVPASFRHDVDKGHSRTVYGGVHILGIARHINPAQMNILANQTRQAGQRLWQNKVWGDAANRYHATLVQQRFPRPEYELKIDRFFKNPIAPRYPDVTVYSNGKPVHCSEVKTGGAPVNPRQARVDSWINGNKCPTELVRYPGCPVNLSEYTNCRVQ
jgi:curved DNA-binding protein CbpA